MRKNACELKIDLLCRGMRLDGHGRSREAVVSARTRAGLGSGVEVVLRGKRKDFHVNVPVLEPFAARSPYRLVLRDGRTVLVDDRDGDATPVEVPAPPRWSSQRTSRGTSMNRVAAMQGTYLAVYVGEVCDFWTMDPPRRCRFCTTGLNVGSTEEAAKDVQDVVETAREAKREHGITFVHLNSGFHRDHRLDFVVPYVRAIKREVGALVGLQLAPVADLSQYDRLIALGVDHFSFCYEFHNEYWFRRHCPGKHEHLTQEAFFRALEYTSRRLGKGRVSGEVIAGLEPIEDTLRAIDYITGVGAFPTVCIFRPLVGSDLEGEAPPEYEAMREVFIHLIEALRRHRIPIGLAPGIEVSLVVTPADALELAPDTWGWRAYRIRLAAMKALATPYFRYRMRRHDPGP